MLREGERSRGGNRRHILGATPMGQCEHKRVCTRLYMCSVPRTHESQCGYDYCVTAATHSPRITPVASLALPVLSSHSCILVSALSIACVAHHQHIYRALQFMCVCMQPPPRAVQPQQFVNLQREWLICHETTRSRDMALCLRWYTRAHWGARDFGAKPHIYTLYTLSFNAMCTDLHKPSPQGR